MSEEKEAWPIERQAMYLVNAGHSPAHVAKYLGLSVEWVAKVARKK